MRWMQHSVCFILPSVLCTFSFGTLRIVFLSEQKSNLPFPLENPNFCFENIPLFQKIVSLPTPWNRLSDIAHLTSSLAVHLYINITSLPSTMPSHRRISKTQILLVYASETTGARTLATLNIYTWLSFQRVLWYFVFLKTVFQLLNNKV